MIRGYMDRRGWMSGFFPTDMGTATRRFDVGDLSFEVGDERFKFRFLCRTGFTVRSHEMGWKEGRGHLVSWAWRGDLLVSADAILLVGKGLPVVPMGPDESQDKVPQRNIGPTFRPYCVIRRSEIKGWRSKGDKLEIFCYSIDEFTLVPVSKMTVIIRKADQELCNHLEEIRPQVENPRDLNARFPTQLPPKRVPQLKPSLFVLAPLVAGFAVYLAGQMMMAGFPVDSAEYANLRNISVAGVLIGAIGTLPVVYWIDKRMITPTKQEYEHVFEEKRLQDFISQTRDLANQFSKNLSKMGFRLDFSPASLQRGKEIEISIGNRFWWSPSMLRYAAYIGEVFIRDLKESVTVTWEPVQGRAMLFFKEAGLACDVINLVGPRVFDWEFKEEMSLLEEYENIKSQVFSCLQGDAVDA